MQRASILIVLVAGGLILGCAGNPAKPYRLACDRERDLAWQAFDLSSAEGFAGTAS
jgi:hypothetical protein